MRILMTLAAASAFSITALVAPPAMADECRDQVEEDCALFMPRGSAGWAHCVEIMYELSCGGTAVNALMDIEAIRETRR